MSTAMKGPGPQGLGCTVIIGVVLFLSFYGIVELALLFARWFMEVR